MYNLRHLYIFFLILALNLSFFSTTSVKAKAFLIDEIEISEKLENNFNKDLLINRGFEKAFKELMSKLIQSKYIDKTNNISLNQIKSMIETFSIKEEKFINKTYNLNLGVSFNKKKIFKYLESKNIFPAQIMIEKFLFIPIIIDENINDLSIFSNNPIYQNWNSNIKTYELIEYLLPSEDLEDLSLIKENLNSLETYDFKEIIKKYDLNNYIISLIFKNNNEIRVLSKIYNDRSEIIKNNSFQNLNLNNDQDLRIFTNSLRNLYEDTWKRLNEINTSIKLSIVVKTENDNLNKSTRFELDLNDIELVNDYSIQKFNKKFIFYEILFNGTVQNFINIMENKNYNLNTQKKIWILE